MLQSNSLLATKLYISVARPNLVSRPRLLARLNQGMRGKLVLLSAPPGFGKTTLLGEWRTSAGQDGQPFPMAWVSLDEGDNDPVRFWSYCVAALEKLQPGVEQNALALLQSKPAQALELGDILTTLLNSITAEITEDFALVLDDYHFIQLPALHESVTFLLDHLPPQMHLIITSRVDPPLPLSRLRARGQLLELRAEDLRFTLTEATQFLNRIMGLSLAEEDVARLEERTEGWVTGLQLAALSMQGRHDLSSFIQAFRGNHRFVLDYLAEEVLQQQPGNIQNFLLETSLLDRLSAPLVEAVTGISGGQALLEQLEHGNLFLVRLDDERRWYRYHHLFADFLRNRLQQTQPERVAEVHRRAAKWFEQNNLPEQGVSHALAGRDFEQAALLLENIAQAMLMRGELTTLLGWIQALPLEAVRVRPHLGVYYAGTLMATGQLESAEAYLAEIESYLSSRQEVERSQAEIIRGEMAAIQALIVTSRGELARTLELGHKALQRLPPESHFFRGIAAWALGATSYMTGDLVEGKKALSESMRTGYASGNLLVALLSGYTLGFLHVMEGRLHQAQQIYEQTMQMVQPVVLTPDKVSRPMPFVSICYAGIGDLKREWNELEEAERYLKEAIEWGKQFPNLGILLDSFIFQARLKRALEDWPAAFEAIRQAEQVVAENESSPWDALQVQAHKARIWLALGNLAAANSWAEQRYGVNASSDLVKVGKATTKTADKIFPGLLGEMETTTLARLRIAQGRPQEALELLKQLQTEAEASGRNGSLIEFLSLQALAFEGLGEGQQALVALGRALALAEPEGYVRLFLDEGQPMRDLLAKFAEAQHANTLAELPPVPASYLQKLLSAVRPDLTNQAFEAVSSPTPSPQPLTPLIEPLTERELTVLRLLSDGKSNQEIAQALVVELSTAKWHLNNLYGKLGVRSRTQALARAKELSLL